ncbi:MAG TPA: hypothetical protein VFR41_13035 [Acidimicrobiia bacterium]|nr:hypothetical protein [Acidimicrobiia bacterium]
MRRRAEAIALVAFLAAGACSSGSSTHSTTTTTVPSLAVTPKNGRDAARMAAAYLIAAYGTADPTVGGVWAAGTRATRDGVQVQAFEGAKAPGCEPLMAARRFFGVSITVVPVAMVRGRARRTTSSSASACQVPKQVSDPIAATRPAPPTKAADRALTFVRAYEQNKGWFAGTTGMNQDGSSVYVGITVKSGKQQSATEHCAELEPLIWWFTGTRATTVQVLPLTPAGSPNAPEAIDCPR